MSNTQSIFNYFDGIFFINMDHRKDRLESAIEEFKKQDINATRYPGCKVYISELHPSAYDKLVSPHKFKTPYIESSIGCKTSQYNIIRLAKERRYKNVLIFEDDIQFLFNKEKTQEILNGALKELPEDYDLLYFSGNHLKTLETIQDKNFILRTKGTLTCHAYCINSKIFDYLLDNMMKVGIEIDNYYINEIQSRGNSYVVHPGLVTQAPSFSDILQRNVDYTNVIN